MSKTQPPLPDVEDPGKPLPPEDDKPGTNEVQHQPNPRAEPTPDGTRKYWPSSPYVTGND